MPQPPTPSVTLWDLLAALNFACASGGHGVVDEVIRVVGAERSSVLFFGRALGQDTKHHVAAVIQDIRFQHWLQDLGSRTLTVSGMLDDPQPVDTAAPMSYMCGLLVGSFSQRRYIHPIAFFCRLHLEPSDPLAGAAGIMRSLTAQLAILLSETRELDLSHVTRVRHPHQPLALQDLPSICRVFEYIIRPLRAGVILCMIDGVDFYDNALHRAGMGLVMPFLNSLVQAIAHSGTGLVSKLLVTSHVGGSYLPEWFPSRGELHLTDEVLHNNGTEEQELEEFGMQGF